VGCDTVFGILSDEVLARWLLETHARALDGHVTDPDTLNIPHVDLVQAKSEVLVSIAWNYVRDSKAHLSLNPFLTSIAAGCANTVEIFIRSGASIHHVDGYRTPALAACLAGATPFWWLQNSNAFGFASKPDHLMVAMCLLINGADPTLVYLGETPLCYARRHGGDLHEFISLLEAQPKVQRALKRRTCANCGGEGSLAAPPFQKCACCESVRYCSRDCQIMHWKRAHRGECQPKASLAG
jgi:hypothetical protein